MLTIWDGKESVNDLVTLHRALLSFSFAFSSRCHGFLAPQQLPSQHPLFFLQAPSFFNSSQLPVICNRCVLMENPSWRVISFSSFSILSLSNSTIFSQSLQMMWLWLGCSA